MRIVQSFVAYSLRNGTRIAISLGIVFALALSLTNPISQAISRRSRSVRSTVLAATIRPHHLVTISSTFPANVIALHVTSGQEVKAGEVLMSLSDPEFEMEYQRAKVHLEAVGRRMGVHSAAGGNSDGVATEHALHAATERLASFSIGSTQTTYDKATQRVERVEQLLAQGAATNAELDDAKKTAMYAARDLQNEREHLSRLKEEVEIAQARATQSAHPAVTNNGVEQMNLQMEYREAETALQIASQRLDSETIVASTPGTVLKVVVTPGDQIPSGYPLVQIGQLDRLDFDVPVDPLIARRLKQGQIVKVKVPTEPPTELTAPISAILLIPSQEQSAYTVRITAKNPAPSAILVGLAGEVEFRN